MRRNFSLDMPRNRKTKDIWEISAASLTANAAIRGSLKCLNPNRALLVDHVFASFGLPHDAVVARSKLVEPPNDLA